jgi:hypothetical protein
MDAQLKENFNSRMRITMGIKDSKIQNATGYFQDTKQQKEENVEYWFMRMQFARVFVLFTSILMIAQAVAEYQGEKENISDLLVIILLVNTVQGFLTLLFIIGSFYDQKLLSYIKYGIYSLMIILCYRLCNFGLSELQVRSKYNQYTMLQRAGTFYFSLLCLIVTNAEFNRCFLARMLLIFIPMPICIIIG